MPRVGDFDEGSIVSYGSAFYNGEDY